MTTVWERAAHSVYRMLALYLTVILVITKTRPCNILQFFTVVKKDNFQMKNCVVFLIFAYEAVLTSTHNLCFGEKIRKIVYPCKPRFYYIKVGCKGVYITRTCHLMYFIL